MSKAIRKLAAAIGTGAVYYADRHATGSIGVQLSGARRYSSAAFSALDAALERSGRFGTRLERIKELARGIQECALSSQASLDKAAQAARNNLEL
jgi:hypothetical protein